MKEAACRDADAEIFFPQKGQSGKEALKICNTKCQVREECLQYAIDNNERYGIWGGMTELKRRELAKHIGEIAS